MAGRKAAIISLCQIGFTSLMIKKKKEQSVVIFKSCSIIIIPTIITVTINFENTSKVWQALRSEQVIEFLMVPKRQAEHLKLCSAGMRGWAQCHAFPG